KLYVPSAKPAPRMGPISGEISIAPVITAVELRFRPTEAISIAQASTHTFAPRKDVFAVIFSRTRFLSSSPACRLRKSNILLLKVAAFKAVQKVTYFLRVIYTSLTGE